MAKTKKYAVGGAALMGLGTPKAAMARSATQQSLDPAQFGTYAPGSIAAKAAMARSATPQPVNSSRFGTYAPGSVIENPPIPQDMIAASKRYDDMHNMGPNNAPRPVMFDAASDAQRRATMDRVNAITSGPSPRPSNPSVRAPNPARGPVVGALGQKAMAKGGTVRGVGIAQKGFRPCKVR